MNGMMLLGWRSEVMIGRGGDEVALPMRDGGRLRKIELPRLPIEGGTVLHNQKVCVKK
jgi:hypothetical protein